MRTDPRGLRLFLAVCRAGTISGAARAEHLSQPSVSVAIAQLERSLGTKLFDRHRQGIQLTAAGRALQLRAEAMENLIDAAQREIELIDKNIAGPLIVGGTPGALATLVPRVIEPLIANYPRFEMKVLERPDHVLEAMLRSYEIDLAIVTAKMREHPEDIQEMISMSDELSLIVGNANAHLPAEISLSELGEARWVLPDAVGAFRRHVDALFIGAEEPFPDNVIRSDSLLATKEIVRTTDYVAILPRQVAAAEIKAGNLRAVRIREATFKRQVGVLWLRERQLSELAQAFLNAARP